MNIPDAKDVDNEKEIIEFIFFNYEVPREYRASLDALVKERDDLLLMLFQPIGASHHDANKCPYCKENLNGK